MKVKKNYQKIRSKNRMSIQKIILKREKNALL